MIEQSRPHSAAHGHEPTGANVRAVYVTGAVMAAVVVGSFLLMLGLLSLFSDTTGNIPASQFDTPDATAQPAQQLQKLRARERELLANYQWVDATAGIARIPIERAMEIIAERGLAGVDINSQAAETTPDEKPPRQEGDEP